MAVRCGMAVIGIQIEIAAPMPEPMISPIMIQTNVTICSLSSVPIIATSMPIAANCMPWRALSGEVSPLSPRMNRTLADR